MLPTSHYSAFENIFLLKPAHQTAKPVQHPQHPACENSKQDNRSCNGENLAAHTENLSLFLKFNSRGRH